MELSERGASRVRGYLYVLERSLKTFLPAADAVDAAREVESHIRERIAEAPPSPDEKTTIERVLDELGSPLKVARAYSLELSAHEAVATGRLVPIARALVQLAALGVTGFLGALAIFVGYSMALGFLAIAVLKPIFPDNVGLFVSNGWPVFGAQFPAEGAGPYGGYAIIPISIAIGLAILIGTHLAARRWIESWLRRRRERAAFAR
jgi:uncharacterized membrane protein